MRTAAALAALLLLHAPPPAAAQGEKQVRVELAFRQSGVESRDDLRGGGSVVILGDRVGAGGRLGAASTTTRTTRSSGIFTIVQDGGSSSLSVSTRLPYEDVVFLRDYLTGAGYVSSGVTFETVGTALRVSARALDDERILVDLTPTVSWLSADGSGAIDVTEAATGLVVRSGEPVVIGGSTTETNEVTRRILGLGRASGQSETTLVLTAKLL